MADIANERWWSILFRNPWTSWLNRNCSRQQQPCQHDDDPDRLFRLVEAQNWQELIREFYLYPNPDNMFVSSRDRFRTSSRRCKHLIDHILENKYAPDNVIWAAIAADPAGLTQRNTIDYYLPLHHACYQGNSGHIRIILEAYPLATRIYAEGHGLPLMCYLTASSFDRCQSVMVVEKLVEKYPRSVLSKVEISETQSSTDAPKFQPVLRTAYRNWLFFHQKIRSDKNDGQPNNVDATILHQLNERWNIIEFILRKRHSLRNDRSKFSLLKNVLKEELSEGFLEFTDLPLRECIQRDQSIRELNEMTQNTQTVLHQLILLENKASSPYRKLRFEKHRKAAIDEFLEICPRLSSIRDEDGRLPLHLAIERRRDFTVLEALMDNVEDCLVTYDKKVRMFPFMSAAISDRYSIDVVFNMLIMRPDVVCLFNSVGSR